MMFECIDKIYPSVSIDTVTGSICNFTDNIGGLPLKSCTSLISGYQEGSGTPSPDNVRPLHYFSAANIGACGVNLMAEFAEGEYELNGIKATVTNNNLVTITGQKTSSGGMNLTIPLKSDFLIPKNAYVHFRNSIANASIVLTFRTSSSAYIAPSLIPANRIYQTPNSFGLINSMNIYFGGNITEELNFTIQSSIELTNEVTDFTPYNGNTTTFTFGQDIYQGSIDWERGVVVGLWSGKVDMGLLNWEYNSNYQAFYISLPNMYIPTTGQERMQGIANEVYPISTVDAISSMDDKSCLRYNGYLWTKDSDYTDRDDFKNSLIGKYVAYELATPIEIPLGGIQLLTQQVNNIFADCGDTTVEYINIT